MIVPVGFGQRGTDCQSAPRAGKTILMQKMAKAALWPTIPNLYVFMLLIDERPEEVTDMERQVKGPNCEVISSTFDEPAVSTYPGLGDGSREGEADGRVRLPT